MNSEQVWFPFSRESLKPGYYDVQVRSGREYIGGYLNPHGSLISGKGKVTLIEKEAVARIRPTYWPAVFAARNARKNS